MEKELLNLTPKRFLCPYCGEWHAYKKCELGYYDSSSNEAFFTCDKAWTRACTLFNDAQYRIYFYGGYLYYAMAWMCKRDENGKFTK